MVGTLVRRPLPPVSDFIRTLLDDADATAALATLGVVSGTYTPTLTNGANVDSSTAFLSHYLRVGNVVTVTGRIAVDATAAAPTATTVGISLPVASNFSVATDCGGLISLASSTGGPILADTVNDRATATYPASITSNQSGGFSFMYTVI
jgi:hypothetical protein